MVPQWKDSADKHGVARQDAVYVILHNSYTDVLADEPREEGQIRLFIGQRHAQALPEDEVEILVHEFPDQRGREAVVFHVQPLSAKFRRYREENPKS